MQNTSILEIKRLSKRFGGAVGIDECSLTLARGEKLVVCGPSGSGKSTLIRCINRMEVADSGTVAFENTALDDGPKSRAALRAIGMVFQQFNLFPHLTVVENAMLAPMRVQGLRREAARSVAMAELAKVRIADQAHKYPAQLSGGQQQRVAIARALCLSPRLMLFDEPTSSLDPETVKEVLDTMVDLARAGMSMIVVTHEMGFAKQVADRVVFMDRGRIVEVATPRAFFGGAASDRAKLFLGKLERH